MTTPLTGPNAFSVDLEDWYHPFMWMDAERRRGLEDRLRVGAEPLLELLDRYSVRATFFILGQVAEQHPGLVAAIARSGHEIASHGYGHQFVYRQSVEEFRADVRRSVETIVAACGSRPVGYRAPNFSFTKASLWAPKVLQEEGFTFDSSIVPTALNPVYGLRGAPRHVHQDDNGLWEFPIPTLKILGMGLPIAGGLYLRSLPYFVTRRALHAYNRHGWPAVVYVHPWELDTGQPRVGGMPLMNRIARYRNLDSTYGKIERLLNDFEFAPLSEVIHGR